MSIFSELLRTELGSSVDILEQLGMNIPWKAFHEVNPLFPHTPSISRVNESDVHIAAPCR
jgi:hypothetical protein